MSHTHAPANYNKAFVIGIALNVIYIVVEVIVGLTIHSVALLADAGHNLSDVVSLLLAWGASYLTQLPPSKRRTYGLRKTSVLASLTNAIILLIAIGAIAWEAIRRFAHPQAIPGGTVMWVAGIGVVINTATALLFMKGRKGDINIRGAYLHMAADAGVSVGVVLAGLAISLTGLLWIDPLVSLLIVVVIAISTWGLLRDSVNLAMDAVPEGIDPAAVRRYLGEQPGITEVHDLHIWAMSTTETALTAHLVKPERDDEDAFLSRLTEKLHDRFEIIHTTIQLERGGECDSCDQADPANRIPRVDICGGSIYPFQPTTMGVFQNRIVQIVGAVIAFLVFSGDVLDDVWNVSGDSVVGHVSHSAGHTKGNTPKSGTPSHDDTVAIGPSLTAPIPALPRVFEYLDLDVATPVGVPPAIDHPPQLA